MNTLYYNTLRRAFIVAGATTIRLDRYDGEYLHGCYAWAVSAGIISHTVERESQCTTYVGTLTPRGRALLEAPNDPRSEAGVSRTVRVSTIGGSNPE